jgi:putative addiction module component (TIGR02574 family)
MSGWTPSRVTTWRRGPQAQNNSFKEGRHRSPQIAALMRKRVICVIFPSMLLERFPEVQSLDPEDKWRLIDELWSDLARQVEGEAPNANIVELLEKRFSDYLVDPSQGQSADEVFARLAEHKRQWK